MKPLVVTVVIAALFAMGVGAGYVYLTQTGEPDTTGAGAPAQPTAAPARGAASLHGKSIAIPENAVLCAKHNVPEVICPFCTPSLIEDRGFCGGHDVPEALCTRCSPALIAAFKVEGDWCAEHGLPESQCLVCNPKTGG